MSISNNTQSITSIILEGENLTDTVNALKARQNSLTSALSSNATDYNTEIIDARADTFGNSHNNLGENIRANQLYLYNLIIEKFSVLQQQYDYLAQCYINLAGIINNLTEGD